MKATTVKPHIWGANGVWVCMHANGTYALGYGKSPSEAYKAFIRMREIREDFKWRT